MLVLHHAADGLGGQVIARVGVGVALADEHRVAGPVGFLAGDGGDLLVAAGGEAQGALLAVHVAGDGGEALGGVGVDLHALLAQHHGHPFAAVLLAADQLAGVLVAGVGVGVALGLLLAADQVIIVDVAVVGVRVRAFALGDAADQRMIGSDAIDGVRVRALALGGAADQDVVHGIAALAVGMRAVALGDLAGQHVGIAGVGVLVRLGFKLAADQLTGEALGGVDVAGALLHAAGRLHHGDVAVGDVDVTHALLQAAGQLVVVIVAFRGVDVAGVLLQAAGQLPHGEVAVLGVMVGRVFVLAADQRRHVLVARLGVHVGLNLAQPADQVAAVVVAPAIVDVIIQALHIAAGQVATVVVAILAVHMGAHIAGERAANLILGLRLGQWTDQRIARERVPVLLQPAPRNVLQRVGVHLQGIHRQQHDDRAQQGDRPPQPRVPLPFPYKTFCLKIHLSLHGFDFLNYVFHVVCPRPARLIQ